MFDPVGICKILNEEGVAFVIVGGFASVMHGSPLPTRDITFTPSGGLGGLEEWSTRALSVEIEEGTSVRIAALDDIIDSKRAANRPKDQMALPYLESLRDELRNR